MAWNLENSVALGREGTGLAQVMNQPSLKELTTSPYAALAAKKAAAKKDEFKITDVNPTTPIPEDRSLVEKENLKNIQMQANFLRQGMSAATHPDEYAAIQNQKQNVENIAVYSQQYGQKEADMIKKVNADKYSYPPNALELINGNRALPLIDANGNRVAGQTRELDPANLFPKIDNINVNQEIKKFGYPSYHSEAIANWNGMGGGKSKKEFVFDEAQAGRSYAAAVANDSDKGYMVKLTKRAADEAKAAYNKNIATTGNTWDDLSDTDRDNFVDAKKQTIYIDTLRDLAKQDIAEVNKANRIYKDKDGSGGGAANAGKGGVSFGYTPIGDGTYKMRTVVQVPPVAAKTGTDTPNPLNYLNDASGNTMPTKVQFTGKIIKDEGGQWQVEYRYLEPTEDQNDRPVKIDDIGYVPYSKNKDLLKTYGYKHIDEVVPPAERARQYELNKDVITTPEQYNKNHATDKTAEQKDAYKKWYDNYQKKKGAGWKNTSDSKKETAQAKVKAEEAINDQVANLSNQEKKVGTYNPLTGQINFA